MDTSKINRNQTASLEEFPGCLLGIPSFLLPMRVFFGVVVTNPLAAWFRKETRSAELEGGHDFGMSKTWFVLRSATEQRT